MTDSFDADDGKEHSAVIDRATAATGPVEVNFNGLPLKINATLDPEALQRRILTRLFNARDLDEAFSVWETQSSDELEGKVFTVTGVAWGVYDSQERGPIPLAEVHTVDAEGEEQQGFVTTAANLVGFLAWAESRQAFPFTARVLGDKTSRGRTSLRFARP